jgi:hypothetical protein
VAADHSPKRKPARVCHRIESRAADDLEHVGSGGLLRERLAQLVEQSGVLDGDNRLGGEILDQLDVLIRKRTHLLAIDDNGPNQLLFFQQLQDCRSTGAAPGHCGEDLRHRGLCRQRATAQHAAWLHGEAAGGRRDASQGRRSLDPPYRRRDLIVRYNDVLLAQIQQSVACNALHTMEARLCRWLLQTRDCVDGNAIPRTQEFLGQMLGVRRTTVTLAARLLQSAGIIRYRRGLIQNPRSRGARSHLL